MKRDNRPIGVFDSGVGGLTVLEVLQKDFPTEDFIYVADQGHCPYGVKSNEELIKITTSVAKYLESRNCKMIIIACNTATLFIDYIRQAVNIPVVGVIEPTAKRAASLSSNKKIAVIATNATIAKGAYQKILTENNCEVFPVACSEFVDFIENKDLNDPEGDLLVANKLSVLKGTNVDTLIHGCTHFSLIEDQIRKVLGDINYVACGNPTSEYVYKMLLNNQLLCDEKERYVEINTTGDVDKALQSMKWFKEEHLPVRHIDL